MYLNKLNNVITSLFNPKKVRLVAIAKDESAYLPAWIFHHLHFGFDEIEIYINNTSDDSSLILDQIGKNYPVNYIMADFMYEQLDDESFQIYAYKAAHKKALKENIDYLLFLDIDEFWTPLDFTSTIQTCLRELNSPDIISFEWVLKRNEATPFSFPYTDENSVGQFHIVKSLFKTSLENKNIHVHNVLDATAHNVLADGQRHPRPGQWTIDGELISIKPYFILHRLWRSQLEYIYLLGQGMKAFVSKKEDTKLDIKNNRNGYLLPKKRVTTLIFKKKIIDKHKKKYNAFLTECELHHLVNKAQLFVLDRTITTLNAFKQHQEDEVLKKVTTSIDFTQVENQIKQERNRIVSYSNQLQ
jgi:hypothetical protein